MATLLHTIRPGLRTAIALLIGGVPLLSFSVGAGAALIAGGAALLAFLAVTGRRCSRDELSELLFPRQDRDRARSNLRQALSLLREAIGDRIGAPCRHLNSHTDVHRVDPGDGISIGGMEAINAATEVLYEVAH